MSYIDGDVATVTAISTDAAVCACVWCSQTSNHHHRHHRHHCAAKSTCAPFKMWAGKATKTGHKQLSMWKINLCSTIPFHKDVVHLIVSIFVCRFVSHQIYIDYKLSHIVPCICPSPCPYTQEVLIGMGLLLFSDNVTINDYIHRQCMQRRHWPKSLYKSVWHLQQYIHNTNYDQFKNKKMYTR